MNLTKNLISVCHVISGYYRNDPRIFQRQCKSLRDANFSVCILTNDNQPDEILEGIPIYSSNNFSSSRLRILLFAKKQFLKPFTIIPGGRAVGWLEQEVDQWILDRIETCRLESI